MRALILTIACLWTVAISAQSTFGKFDASKFGNCRSGQVDETCLNTALTSAPSNRGISVVTPDGTITANHSITIPVSATPGSVYQVKIEAGGPNSRIVKNFTGAAVDASGRIENCSSSMTADVGMGSLTVSVANPSCFPTTGNPWVILSDASNTSGACKGWSVQPNYSCNMELRQISSISGNTLGLATSTSGSYRASSNGMVTLVTPVSVDLDGLTIDSRGHQGAIVQLRYFVDSTISVLSGEGGGQPYTQGIAALVGNGLNVTGTVIKNQDGLKATGSRQFPIAMSAVENFTVHNIWLRNVGEGIDIGNYSRHGDVGEFICDGTGDSCANTHGNNNWDITFHDFAIHGCAVNAGATASACTGIIVSNGNSAAPDHDVIVTNGHIDGYRRFGVEIDGSSSAGITGVRNIMVSNVEISDPLPVPPGTPSNGQSAFFATYTTGLTVSNVRVRNVQCGQSGFEILGVDKFDISHNSVVQEWNCPGGGTTFGFYLNAGSRATTITDGIFDDNSSFGTDSYPLYVGSGCPGCVYRVNFLHFLGTNRQGDAKYIWPSAANMVSSPRWLNEDGINDLGGQRFEGR